MELFIGVIAVVVILFVLHVSHAPEEPKLELQGGTARLTPTEATQLNRIFVLQGSAPDLALQLAAQLWGDAWQLAHVSLCSRLMLLDREEEALELLWKLDSAYREQALQTMLQELVNRGDTDKALQLQKRFDVTCSNSPLTHGTLLLAEATRDLPTTEIKVQTPLTETSGRVLSSQPVVIPVLRAGLGFVHAAQELMPNADVGFIGVSRDEETFEPKQYVNKLPETLAGRTCFVLDPMLATGGSLAHACELLMERNPTGPITVICVLAAPEGIEFLKTTGLNLRIFTASIDERLNENAFIVPGLGDAGDRQFGPPH